MLACRASAQNGWVWSNLETTGNTLRSVNVIDSSRIWVFGDAGTVLTTNDFGENWVIHYTNITEDIFSSAFINDNLGFVACGSGNLYRTKNGGKNWELLNSQLTGDIIKIRFINQSIGVCLSRDSNFSLTYDGGDTWERSLCSLPQNTVSFDFINKNSLIFLASDGHLLKTKGFNKIEFSTSLGQVNTMNFIHTAPNGYIFAGGTEGILYSSFDNAQTWLADTIGWKRDLYGIAFSDDTTGQIVGWHSVVPKTTDGGKNWTDRFTGQVFSFYDIDFADAYGCVVGERGKIMTTKNKGKTFQYIGQLNTTTIKNINNAVVIDDTTIFIVGWNGTLMKTTDYGKNWSKKSSRGAIEYFGTTSLGKKTIWAVGQEGEIRYSHDYGETFHSINSGTFNTLHDIEFTDSSSGWIVGDAGTLLHTTNGGINWNTINFNKEWNFRNLAITAKEIWITGEKGLCVWMSRDMNEPNLVNLATDVDLNEIIIRNDKSIWIAGSNGTLLMSDDNGETWEQKEVNCSLDINSICFISEQSGFLCGEDGLIMQTVNRGHSWHIEHSWTKNNLKKLNFLNRDHGIAVGESGAVLIFRRN